MNNSKFENDYVVKCFYCIYVLCNLIIEVTEYLIKMLSWYSRVNKNDLYRFF